MSSSTEPTADGRPADATPAEIPPSIAYDQPVQPPVPDVPPYAPAPVAAPTSSVTGPNQAGRASLIAGIILTVVGLAQQVLYVFLPSIISTLDLEFSTAYAAIQWPFTIVTGLLSVAAIIFGIIGLTRPSLPRAAAGAGTALGAASLLSIVVAGATQLFGGLLS